MITWLCMNPDCEWHMLIPGELADRTAVHAVPRRRAPVVPPGTYGPENLRPTRSVQVERRRVFCGATLVGYVCSACAPNYQGLS